MTVKETVVEESMTLHQILYIYIVKKGKFLPKYGDESTGLYETLYQSGGGKRRKYGPGTSCRSIPPRIE